MWLNPDPSFIDNILQIPKQPISEDVNEQLKPSGVDLMRVYHVLSVRTIKCL